MKKLLRRLRNHFLPGRETLSKTEQKRLEQEVRAEAELERKASSYIQPTKAQELLNKADEYHKQGDIPRSNHTYQELCKLYVKDKLPQLALNVAEIQLALALRTGDSILEKIWARQVIHLTATVHGAEPTIDAASPIMRGYSDSISCAIKAMDDPKKRISAEAKAGYMRNIRKYTEMLKFYGDRWAETTSEGGLEKKSTE